MRSLTASPGHRWRPWTADGYDDKLDDLLFHELQIFRLKLTGKSVLLKPNLVEDLPRPLNTNAAIIGTGRVEIAEGPAHRRNTELVVDSCGLARHLEGSQIAFVDLTASLHRGVS